MQIILLEKVHNLGELGEQVRVRAGYGRNYLIPKGKAVPATAANITAFEGRRAELEKVQNEALSLARSRAEKLAAVNVTIAKKAGEEGKLYGSVGTVDIAEAVNATGVELTRQEVRLPEGPLRLLGEYRIAIHLHSDVDAEIGVTIVPEAE